MQKWIGQPSFSPGLRFQGIAKPIRNEHGLFAISKLYEHFTLKIIMCEHFFKKRCVAF